jgi:hypothetical protein
MTAPPSIDALRECDKEILQCPFCGRMPVGGQVKAGVEWWQVECEADRGDGCGAVIMRSTWASAIDAWNQRAASPGYVKPGDAMVERVAIVAWLRGEVETDYTDPQYDLGINLAEAIERGDHLAALTPAPNPSQSTAADTPSTPG